MVLGKGGSWEGFMSGIVLFSCTCTILVALPCEGQRPDQTNSMKADKTLLKTSLDSRL